jgi:hypothetical protein
VHSFGVLGSEGWELVAIHDKASNWIGGAEKGFAIFKREVPVDAESPKRWATWEYAEQVASGNSMVGLWNIGPNPSQACLQDDHLPSCTEPSCTCQCHNPYE